MNSEQVYKSLSKCFHCGDDCLDEEIFSEDKQFCCVGCKVVYEILSENNLCEYYNIEDNPGLKIKFEKRNFDFLEDEKVRRGIITFTDNKITIVKFKIPNIHCSSCIWLLENLTKLDPDIESSLVNFPEKTVKIKYKESDSGLVKIVSLLYKLGYEPDLSHNESAVSKSKKHSRSLYIKLGVAGFAFGNIMLFSFPEYLAGSDLPTNLKNIFSYLNILVSLPVFFYCSSDYFTSSYRSLKNGYVSIDIPIAIGIITLFSKSLYDILILGEPGYLDSLAGLLFFLLTGKVFQNKTYESLNFERDYKSYFPIGINVIKQNGEEISIPISNLKASDRILIRNGEIIPVDAILFRGEGNIDYSFVTGEAIPQKKVPGEIIYAGGKHIGEAIELEVIRVVSKSYFTELWNDPTFKKSKNPRRLLVNIISKYFTLIVLLIAFTALGYWLIVDPSKAINAFTTVLIIACPCALALATPFTTGNALRILGRSGLYLKNAQVVEDVASADTIVFDKTGTLTDGSEYIIDYTGKDVSLKEKSIIRTLSKNSTHPLSRILSEQFKDFPFVKLVSFSEKVSSGISGYYHGSEYKLGSLNFTSAEKLNESIKGSEVYFSIDGSIRGSFTIKNRYRKDIKPVIDTLSKNHSLSVLSGDNDNELENLKEIFPHNSKFSFNQTPQDKLEYIKSLQNSGAKVLMIGDGINDAGALKQSNAGLTISENVNNFSPSSDGILEAGLFSKFPEMIDFSKFSKRIIIASFIISFMYNFVGLSFAVQGLLSPVIAAILMPVSSISIVLFTTGATNLYAKIKNL